MQLVLKMMAPGKSGNSLSWSCQAPPKLPQRWGYFFRPGIAVGRQHFAVGIDVDAFALGLLEEFLQHRQVMAGDQDALAFRVPRFTFIGSGGGKRSA